MQILEVLRAWVESLSAPLGVVPACGLVWPARENRAD